MQWYSGGSLDEWEASGQSASLICKKVYCTNDLTRYIIELVDTYNNLPFMFPKWCNRVCL